MSTLSELATLMLRSTVHACWESQLCGLSVLSALATSSDKVNAEVLSQAMLARLHSLICHGEAGFNILLSSHLPSTFKLDSVLDHACAACSLTCRCEARPQHTVICPMLMLCLPSQFPCPARARPGYGFLLCAQPCCFRCAHPYLSE
eukprot:scaffold58531_cov22-Tisochrysis_lutea.AAC.1